MLRSSFQPLERHGTTHESGSSLAGSGPSARSRSRTSSWHARLARSHSRFSTCQSRSGSGPGHASISARKSATSSAGRSMPPSSTTLARLEEVVEVAGGVGPSEPAPEHEVGARRHVGREVELHEREPAQHVEQVGGPRRVEQLRPHRDAPGVARERWCTTRPTLRAWADGTGPGGAIGVSRGKGGRGARPTIGAWPSSSTRLARRRTAAGGPTSSATPASRSCTRSPGRSASPSAASRATTTTCRRSGTPPSSPPAPGRRRRATCCGHCRRSGLRLQKRRGDKGVARVRGVRFVDGTSADVDLIRSPREADESRVFAAMAFVHDDAGDLAVVHSIRRDEWGAPGGWREPGESVRDTAVREV